MSAQNYLQYRLGDHYKSALVFPALYHNVLHIYLVIRCVIIAADPVVYIDTTKSIYLSLHAYLVAPPPVLTALAITSGHAFIQIT